jgi:hypothetical protein
VCRQTRPVGDRWVTRSVAVRPPLADPVARAPPRLSDALRGRLP